MLLCFVIWWDVHRATFEQKRVVRPVLLATFFFLVAAPFVEYPLLIVHLCFIFIFLPSRPPEEITVIMIYYERFVFHLLTRLLNATIPRCFLSCPGSGVLAGITQACFEHCSSQGGTNTHFGTEYSVECFCGDDSQIDKHQDQAETPTCDMDCSGDADETCGGTNAMTVYKITDRPVDTPAPTPSGTSYDSLECYAENEGDMIMRLHKKSSSDINSKVSCRFCGSLFTYSFLEAGAGASFFDGVFNAQPSSSVSQVLPLVSVMPLHLFIGIPLVFGPFCILCRQ